MGGGVGGGWGGKGGRKWVRAKKGAVGIQFKSSRLKTNFIVDETKVLPQSARIRDSPQATLVDLRSNSLFGHSTSIQRLSTSILSIK